MLGWPIILADGIDIPLVLMFGLAILIPLMAFQVVVESAVLSRVWRVRFRDLTRFVFKANIASLLAGIPTKVLNSFIYSLILPWNDLYLYFKRYPSAIAIGTLIFFLVTVLVETWKAFGLRRAYHLPITTRRIWIGMVLANLATYAVLAPIHYHYTQPSHDVREFTADTHWAGQPSVRIRFQKPDSDELMTCRLDGSDCKPATEEQQELPDNTTDQDECGSWKAWAMPGLGSHLRITRRKEGHTVESISIAANPGLMHLSGPYFSRVRLLPGCDECVFEAAQAIYLLDIQSRRVGKIADGENFVILEASGKSARE